MTLSPLRNARQRKPSHLGSYCQLSPRGISSTDLASIGGYGGLIGSLMGGNSCLSSSAGTAPSATGDTRFFRTAILHWMHSEVSSSCTVLKKITLLRERVIDWNGYPFTVSVIAQLNELAFRSRICFFAGE